MRTDELIEVLSAKVEPVSRFAVERRVMIGLAAGAMLAMLILVAWLGLRPDLSRAASTTAFWMKFVFNLAVGVAAMALSCRLGRPACGSRTQWWVLAALISIVMLVGVLQIALAPASERLGIWLGSTWRVCPVRIIVLSIPALIGMLWAFRRLAPTQLRRAGLSAGLAAGGVGASVYALACQESSMAFVATWYSLGILAVGLIGALLGPRLLRW